MPNSPLPNPLSELGARRFSFYPPIRNLEHNEWQFRRATWSEIVVVNTKSCEEALIPLASVGEISIIDDPVVIVGLRRELEWREGAIYPHLRRVIEFPRAIAVNEGRHVSPAPPGHLAPVVNIRLEPRPTVRTSTKAAVGVMLSALVCLVAADILREVQIRQRTDAFRATVRLSCNDGFSSIVNKLGPPANQHVRGDYQLLAYPSLTYKTARVSLVLKGSRYIGALDSSGRIVDTVSLPDHTNSALLLRSLPSF